MPEIVYETVEPRNVTMYPSEWAIVDALAAEEFYGKASAALRRIVREWAQFKALQQALPFQFSPPTAAGGDSGRP